MINNKEEILQNYKIAEKAWLKARDVALDNIKAGRDILEVGNLIEEEIKKYANIGFPINISRNHEAAHYTPKSDTQLKFNKDDFVKVDIGVHSEGYIIDAAFTIDLANRNKDLVNASKNGLAAAEEYVKSKGKESTLSEIGKRIETQIRDLGFKPIANLTGHSLQRYKVHAGTSIFNFDTGNNQKLGTGFFAIEPFATNGIGRIKNGNECGIYFYNAGTSRIKGVRELAEEISKYEKMPFAERWVGKDMTPESRRFALALLAKDRVIAPAPVLVEETNALVSQHEKTFVIFDDETHVFPNLKY